MNRKKWLRIRYIGGSTFLGILLGQLLGYEFIFILGLSALVYEIKQLNGSIKDYDISEQKSFGSRDQTRT